MSAHRSARRGRRLLRRGRPGRQVAAGEGVRLGYAGEVRLGGGHDLVQPAAQPAPGRV
ncbi:hypothetical protein [Micromonospora sp. AB353]|uniref:hypothetical protein n=1 Tax=Micromonospora sp. AB353 TaxID=3413282 RepID=UPI003C1CC322